MDMARDALSALCRSHPSQELSSLSSDLTSIAKRTEAVAQRCAKTKGSLQDGLQLHFNSKRQIFSLWSMFSTSIIDSAIVGCVLIPHKEKSTF